MVSELQNVKKEKAIVEVNLREKYLHGIRVLFMEERIVVYSILIN